MMDAPERIWLARQGDEDWPFYWAAEEDDPKEIEYIRADIAEARIAELEAEVARLRGDIPKLVLDAQLRCMERGRLDTPKELAALAQDRGK